MRNQKINRRRVWIGFVMVVLLFAGCRKKETIAAELSVSSIEISFSAEGNTTDLTITVNAQWSINNNASWVQVSKVTGNSGSTAIKLTAAANTTGATRSGIIAVTSTNGQSRRVTVSQANLIYPQYNTSPQAPDASGMSSTAVQLAAKMKRGINFGNTMESPGEGDWQNSKLTESYVKFVKQLGFNTVRLPVNWAWTHLSDPKKAKIDPVWLNRVKEVVGWCVDNDMYVILNSHDSPHGNANKQDSVNAMQKALWEQIATAFRDFDEHLIFAGLNEPPADDAAQMTILNGYHETFIKAVRSTGGRNSYRVLVVQGPSTDPSKTYDLMNTLPADPVPNRLMVEVHDYTPSLFTIVLAADVTWGNMIFYWGAGNHSTIEPDRNATFGEEGVVLSEMQKMKQKFVDKGIPVVLGEYAAFRRVPSWTNYIPKDLDKHNKSINDWTYYVTKQAKAHGLLPFYWEQGPVLDRKTNTVLDQGILDALIEGSK